MNVGDLVFYRMPSMCFEGYIDTPALVENVLENDVLNLKLDDRNPIEVIFSKPVYGAQRIISNDPEHVTHGWFPVESLQWLYGCNIRDSKE